MDENISTDERNPVEIIKDLMRRDVIKPQYRPEITQAKRFRLIIEQYQASAWVWSYRGYDYALIRNPDKPRLMDLNVRREDANNLSVEYPEHVRDLLNYIEQRASPCGRAKDIFNDRHPYTNPNDPGHTRPPVNPLRPLFYTLCFVGIACYILVVLAFVESDTLFWTGLACVFALITLALSSGSRFVASIRAMPNRGKKVMGAAEWVARIIHPGKWIGG